MVKRNDNKVVFTTPDVLHTGDGVFVPLLISKLMTSKQAAEYLCISERKLWDLQKSQRIPVVRIDRSVRFDRDDLDAFIADAKKR